MSRVVVFSFFAPFDKGGHRGFLWKTALHTMNQIQDKEDSNCKDCYGEQYVKYR
jgi:hypothetical protein